MKHPTNELSDENKEELPMKLVRYGAMGQEKPGLLDRSGRIRDLSALVKDINGDALSPAALA
ncbi:MAG TPA: 2-hydroxyhepta-2,4-diene-1,7-dioate isomerase, partial [Afipia sp.]|nr:2-hydroxyhepta-2,4-diene-1,7-dioate isomerase [Afipia sp.]